MLQAYGKIKKGCCMPQFLFLHSVVVFYVSIKMSTTFNVLMFVCCPLQKNLDKVSKNRRTKNKREKIETLKADGIVSLRCIASRPFDDEQNKQTNK